MYKTSILVFIIIVSGCQINTINECSKLHHTESKNQEEIKNFVINHHVRIALQKIKEKDYELAKIYLEETYNLDPKHQKVHELYNQITQIFPNYSIPLKGCIENVDLNKDKAVQDIYGKYHQGEKYLKDKNYKMAKEEFEGILEILKFAPKKWNIKPSKEQILSRYKKAQRMSQ